MNRIDLPPELLDRWVGPLTEGFDPAKTALLVIDLQVGFVTEGFPAYGPHALDVIPNVNRLTSAFRDAGSKVVFTRHTVAEDPFDPLAWQLSDPFYGPPLDSLRVGAPGYPLHEGLQVAPTDRVIDKLRYSAFLPHSSSLDEELRGDGIDTVVITGTVTNVCCETSARDAHMMGYNVIFVSDANAALDDTSHNAALLNMANYFASMTTTSRLLEKLRRPV